jgi:hypothetical protein
MISPFVYLTPVYSLRFASLCTLECFHTPATTHVASVPPTPNQQLSSHHPSNLSTVAVNFMRPFHSLVLSWHANKKHQTRRYLLAKRHIQLSCVSACVRGRAASPGPGTEDTLLHSNPTKIHAAEKLQEIPSKTRNTLGLAVTASDVRGSRRPVGCATFVADAICTSAVRPYPY